MGYVTLDAIFVPPLYTLKASPGADPEKNFTLAQSIQKEILLKCGKMQFLL